MPIISPVMNLLQRKLNIHPLSILHASKPPLPEILIIPSFHPKLHANSMLSSCDISIDERGVSSEKKDDENDPGCHQQWAGLGEIVEKLASFCEEHSACVVGADVVIDNNGISCAWLVYKLGLQTMERESVVAMWS